jgi:apolipoprotein N-acyltransferase
VGWYDKSHLVPFGEYIPLRQYLPEWVRPLANTVAEFGRGEKYKTLKIGRYPAFAPLICYEIIFSDEIIDKDVKQRPTWAVVLTNDGWYGISSGPHQHLAAAQMRAVEEGITVVRSANSGISAVINPYGEIKAQIPLGERGAIDALVKPEEAHSTLFSQYGIKIPLAMSCILILLALMLSFVPALQRNADNV